LNVGLAHKILALNKQALVTSFMPVNTGVRIPSMDAYDLQGRVRHIDFIGANGGGESRVLYVFSPTCKWCAKNLANIKKLYALKHTSFEFIGVSLESDNLQQYIKSSGFPLDTVSSPSSGAVDTLHLDSTPETIVIDSSGVTRKVWTGAYRSTDCRDIEKYFQIPEGALSSVT
jgi:hypothetical protein